MASYEYSFIIKRSDGSAQVVPVEFLRKIASKSIRITPNLPRKKVLVTYPFYTPRARAILFFESKRDWIIAQLEAMPKKTIIKNRTTLSLFGQSVKVIHAEKSRRGVWLEDGFLFVSGSEEFLARRVKDFIKKEAQKRFSTLAVQYGKKLGKTHEKITMKDTTSRWGSCTSSGNLALSWRLAFAPDWIAEYVVAHEMTHLAEMNHGAKFWKKLDEIFPYDVDEAVKWLARNGAKLHLID